MKRWNVVNAETRAVSHSGSAEACRNYLRLAPSQPAVTCPVELTEAVLLLFEVGAEPFDVARCLPDVGLWLGVEADDDDLDACDGVVLPDRREREAQCALPCQTCFNPHVAGVDCY